MPWKYGQFALAMALLLGCTGMGFCQTELYAAPTIVPTLDAGQAPAYPPISRTYPPAVQNAATAMPPGPSVVQPVGYPSAPYAYPSTDRSFAPAAQSPRPGPAYTAPRYAGNGGYGYSAPSALAFNPPENQSVSASIPGIRPASADGGAANIPAKPLRPEASDGYPETLTSRMLHESQSAGDTTYSLPDCGIYPQPRTDSCSSPALACVKPCNPWYARAGALYMTRNSANRVWVSYQANEDANQLMNTDDIGLAWRAGGEIVFGRTFCCGECGVEAKYWALDPFAGDATISNPHGVSTPLIVDYLDFRDPEWPHAVHDASEYFYGAASQRLWRRDEIHNVEVNFLCNQLYGSSDPCTIPSSQVRWILGLRYFRFEESLTFASLDEGYSWWQDGGIHQAYLDDQVRNNLWGFQTGVELEWGRHLNPYGLSVYVSPKFGIYGNYMEHYFNMYRGDGVRAVPDPTSGVVGSYPVESTGGCVSFLGEIDAGIDWRFHQNWSARIGYRVVAVSGIALSDHQIPTYVNDIPEIAHINRNGDLVLHGGYLGVTYNY